jgi:hypothetical protein
MPLPSVADVVFGQPVPFKNGKGRMCTIEHGNKQKVNFKLSGTLVYQLRNFDEGNPDRVPLVVALDGPADQANNASVITWLDEMSVRILANVADSCETMFPKSKPSPKLIETTGFKIVDDVQGRECVKLRVDLTRLAVHVPNPKAAANDTVISSLKVPREYLDQVLTRGAHVSGTATMEYQWLDDAMGFGVTIGSVELFVEQAPPLAARHLGEFAQDMCAMTISPVVKTFAGGQGRYAGLSIYGEYVHFMANTIVGDGCDGLEVKFTPSVGKDQDPNSNVLGMGLEFAEGSQLAEVLSRMDAMIMGRACEPASADWFPGKKMTPEMAKCLFRPPWSIKPPYSPLVNVKLSRVASNARPATRVWRVPEGTPPRDMGAVMAEVADETCAFERITMGDIPRGAVLGVPFSSSCVYIQAATFGWTIHVSDVFVHPGKSQPLEVGGRTVQSAGMATAEDLEAAFGRSTKRQRVEPEASDFAEFDDPVLEGTMVGPADDTANETTSQEEDPIGTQVF